MVCMLLTANMVIQSTKPLDITKNVDARNMTEVDARNMTLIVLTTNSGLVTLDDGVQISTRGATENRTKNSTDRDCILCRTQNVFYVGSIFDLFSFEEIGSS